MAASSGCAQARPKRQQIVSQLYLKNGLSYEVSFLRVVRNQLDFLHVGRLQQKQTITVGISKILVGTEFFLPAANFHGHEL